MTLFEIYPPDQLLQAKLQRKFPQRILLLRGTADFGTQVDHDLIAAARFRGQCSFLRGAAYLEKLKEVVRSDH